jgi:DNA invertase Pin-like site-specific DNA recombinase
MAIFVFTHCTTTMESIAQKTKDRKKGTELSSEARSAIIDAYQSGISASKIASDFGVSRTTHNLGTI